MNIKTLTGFVLAICLASADLHAITFTVNSILDTGDTNPGDEVCEATTGGTQCTLRAAIEECNQLATTTSTAHRIEFSLGLITINVSGTPLPPISCRVVIDGTTAPSFNTGATHTGDAPPSVYINGTGLGGSTADGFRFFNGLSQSRVLAIGIIGFPDNGVEIVNTDGVVVDGAWIGTGRTGAIALNGGSGIWANGCDNCVFGQKISSGTIEGLGNVIGNNYGNGIYVILGNGTIIGGNAIGADIVGGQDHGNLEHGIHLVGPNARVGEVHVTSGVNTRNYIYNNGGSGIFTETGGHWIYANDIQSNDDSGISLNGSGSNVGYLDAQQGNYVALNGIHGVHIGPNFSSSSNIVRNNRILANTQRGVYVENGGGNEVRDNSIYQNGADAVRLDGVGNTVAGNEIGIYDDVLRGNAGDGVVLAGDDNTVSANLIAGMANDGIDILSGDGNEILNNKVGVGPNGENFGNTANGVLVRAAATNTLIDGNVVGHNTLDGLRLEGGGSRLCANKIGFGPGNQSAGNGVEGVRVVGGGNVIGDVANACDPNEIGHNKSDGIQVESAANIIRDNYIGGRDASQFGNLFGGILLTTGSSLNEVVGNTLSNNLRDGVRVGSGAGTRNRIQENFFEGNADLAIDLKDDGVTANDAGDPDAGANNLQNTPELDSVTRSPTQTQVTYRVNSTTTNSVYPLTVDFYYSSTNKRQGQWMHRDTYAVAANSPRAISFTMARVSGYLMAMVTDADGNSSEFSTPVYFELGVDDDFIFGSGFESGE